MSEPADFRQLDDPAFLAERARLRGVLEHVPENSVDRVKLQGLYEAMNREFDRRARIAWTEPSKGDQTMQDITARARLLAVEVLLAEPELLGNDALETDLYFLRDKLQGAGVTTVAK
jgi:hypothetical protein